MDWSAAELYLLRAILFLCYGQITVLAVQLTLTGNTGSFLSANYPANYLPTTDQTYTATFSNPGPQQVRLEYYYVLQDPYLGTICIDYFTIGSYVNKYCGTGSGVSYITVNGQQLTLRFYSDNYENRQGFNITYTVIEAGACTKPQLNIPGTNTPRTMPIADMLNRSSVMFDVRACSDVIIILKGQPIDPLSRSSSLLANERQIQIGISGNTKCRVTTCIADICEPGTVVNQGHLSCCDWLTFWITWEPGGVVLGLGADTSKGQIASKSFLSTLNIQFLHVAGNNNSHFVISFWAPFLDEACMQAPDLTAPPMCQAETTIGQTTVDETTTAVPLTTVAETTVAGTTVAGRSTVGTLTAGQTTRTETTVSDTTVGQTPSSVPTVAGKSTGPADASTTENTASSLTSPAGRSSTLSGSSLTTTPVQIIAPSAHQLCGCTCVKELPPDPTITAEQAREQLEEEKREAVERIVKELSVHKKNVSAATRRHISAPDERDASMFMGVVAGIVCGVLFGVVVLSDLLALLGGVERKIRTI